HPIGSRRDLLVLYGPMTGHYEGNIHASRPSGGVIGLPPSLSSFRFPGVLGQPFAGAIIRLPAGRSSPIDDTCKIRHWRISVKSLFRISQFFSPAPPVTESPADRAVA